MDVEKWTRTSRGDGPICDWVETLHERADGLLLQERLFLFTNRRRNSTRSRMNFERAIYLGFNHDISNDLTPRVEGSPLGKPSWSRP